MPRFKDVYTPEEEDYEERNRVILDLRRKEKEATKLDQKRLKKTIKEDLDPALLKYAEILFYEGKNISQIIELTKIPKNVLHSLAYHTKNSWSKIRSALKEKRIQLTTEILASSTENYALALNHSSELYKNDILSGKKKAPIQEQKIVSAIIAEQTKVARDQREEEVQQKGLTTAIQVNIGQSEALEILKKDPALLEDPDAS